MPTIDIPDKICPHCGGTKWYINSKTGQKACYKLIIDSNKRYHKSEQGKIALERARAKQRTNLTDDYIRQIIFASIYNTTGECIKRKSIPKEHIEKYREYIKFKRKNKMTSYGRKTVKHKKVKMDRKRKFQNG